jgi:hypothetical protein
VAVSWQEYQNKDKREKVELEIIRARIEDATKDTILWLQVDPSAEERVHVVGIQAQLTDLDRIIVRRMEDRQEAKDDWLWSKTVDEVKSLLEKAREARGHTVGKSLARIEERLPQELPGLRPRLISKALPPITPVGGFAMASYHPKSAQIPLDLPPYYPNDLKPQTQLIIVEAVRKFPDQTRTLELCKYVISELTPLFRAAVQRGTLRADLALSESGGMGTLLHSVLVYNDDGPRSGFGGLSNEAYRLEQEVKKSDEWLGLVKAIVEVEERPDTSDAERQPAESKSGVTVRWLTPSKRFAAKRVSGLPRKIFGAGQAIRRGRNLSGGSAKT